MKPQFKRAQTATGKSIHMHIRSNVYQTDLMQHYVIKITSDILYTTYVALQKTS